MAEVRFLRLTRAVPETDKNIHYVFINHSHICLIHRDTSGTWITMVNGYPILVRESPEEIAAVIVLASSETIKTPAGEKRGSK